MKRKQYVAGEKTFDEFYGQFITPTIVQYVKTVIGEYRIKNSIDPHFNDIPLHKWDNMSNQIAQFIDRDLWRDAHEWDDPKTYPWSKSDGVCIAKTAARRIKNERTGNA